jgi:2-amino-4-hydroxy-6-hydroxymethyldihydropteridine diphosphokinase
MYLQAACQRIEDCAGEICRLSPVYVTEAWGNLNQPAYLNQALELETTKTPLQLIKLLQKTEKQLGRVNKSNNAARTIDIDILFYDRIIFNSRQLRIPHPRLHLRNFTLLPMLDLNKSYTHPETGKSIEQLAKECTDTLKVSIFTRNQKNLKQQPEEK